MFHSIGALRIWVRSTSLYWAVQKRLAWGRFWADVILLKMRERFSRTGSGLRISWHLLKLVMGTMFLVPVSLYALSRLESVLSLNLQLFKPPIGPQVDYYLEQIRVYSQILSAIFSIYFATIGIVVSAGYQRMRRDIIVLLITEQVGSLYSKLLVFSASFCIAASAAPLFGAQPGYLIFVLSTLMVLATSAALFPLGQRLFNFFALDPLIMGEILPALRRSIGAVVNDRLSNSLAHYHCMQSQRLLEQMSYIDDYLKKDSASLDISLKTMSSHYTHLLIFYLKKKSQIERNSYWFPRKPRHRGWFFAGDTITEMALNTNSQIEPESRPDHGWFEKDVIDHLYSHIETAINLNRYNLALDLLSLLQSRVSVYSHVLSFEVGMKEVLALRGVVENALKNNSGTMEDSERQALVGLADTWAGLGGMLCIETLRRMLTFDKELRSFFERDDWSYKGLSSLPGTVQEEVAFIAPRIQFEIEIEGRRLSRPKYLQQLLIQRIILIYGKIIPKAVDFLIRDVREFSENILDAGHAAPATQVLLANLHNYWKLPSWLDRISDLIESYNDFERYKDEPYLFQSIDLAALRKTVSSARSKAIDLLTDKRLVGYLTSLTHDGELPDQLGHAYYVLAEECINGLRLNDGERLKQLAAAFCTLAGLSESRLIQEDASITQELRLHLMSTIVADLAALGGLSILYGEIYQNPELSKIIENSINAIVSFYPDRKKYLTRMLLLSNRRNFSHAMSPREQVRYRWKSEFAQFFSNNDNSRIANHRETPTHSSKIVAAFLRSPWANASDLFLALKVLPELGEVEFEIDYSIRQLRSDLNRDAPEIVDEDF